MGRFSTCHQPWNTIESTPGVVGKLHSRAPDQVEDIAIWHERLGMTVDGS